MESALLTRTWVIPGFTDTTERIVISQRGKPRSDAASGAKTNEARCMWKPSTESIGPMFVAPAFSGDAGEIPAREGLRTVSRRIPVDGLNWGVPCALMQ